MADTNIFISPTEYESVAETLSYGVELAFGGKVYRLFASDDSCSASPSDNILLSDRRYLCHEPLNVFFQEFRKYVLGPHFGLAADRHQMILGLEGLDDPLVNEMEAKNDDRTLWEFWEQAAQPTLRFEMHVQVTPTDNVCQPIVKDSAVEHTSEGVKESTILDLVDVDEDSLSDDDIRRFFNALKRREDEAQITKVNPEDACINSPMSSPPASPQESTITASFSQDSGYLEVEPWVYHVSTNYYDDVIEPSEWSYEDEDSEDSNSTFGSSSKRKLNAGYDGDLSDDYSGNSDSRRKPRKKARVEY